MLIYNFLIFLYGLALRIASAFNRKAAEWRNGRKNFFRRYEAQAAGLYGCTWIHCASLGEFEQGRPLIEMIRQERPAEKILLTFFSPSGYSIRKDYPGADLVTYLPLDTPGNARRFLRSFRPARIIFIKYEFWHNYIREAKRQEIPLYLVSGIFRRRQYFFTGWGSSFRRSLKAFRHFFVQDEASVKLLAQYGFPNATVAGDTRVDRVLELPGTPFRDERIEEFLQGGKAVVFGSTWPADEQLILPRLEELTRTNKVILVPHNPEINHIQDLTRKIGQPFALYSLGSIDGSEKVLVVDTVGMLNRLYRYAAIAYVGGGFGKGIHNILEPAVYGIPVLFGPRHEKFPEAAQLISRSAAFCMHNSFDLSIIPSLLNHPAQLAEIQKSIQNFFNISRGGTKIVYTLLFEE